MTLMQDHVAIITGGAGSLGQHTAHALLEAGAKVVLVDQAADALRQAHEALDARYPNRVITHVADVASSTDTQAYLQATVQRWGRLDALICNAGISGILAPITDYPEDVFDRVLAVNLKSAFLATKYALPLMGSGGSIIYTASVVAVTADPGICAYATAKHALVGLMRVAAKEAAPRGIRVNIIAPGPIDNSFQTTIETHLSTIVNTDATAMLNAKIPLGRHGHPEEIANMMRFLASSQSSFSTGTIFMADGGMHI